MKVFVYKNAKKNWKFYLVFEKKGIKNLNLNKKNFYRNISQKKFNNF